MRHKIIILPVIIMFITLIGCTASEVDPHQVEGPSVTPNEAKEVAKKEYLLTSIDNQELRHLDDNELSYRSEEQRWLTPVYFVIYGKKDQQGVKVYVSSNNTEHHFIIKE